MRYDKQIIDGYIISISTADNGNEADGNITAADYAEIAESLQNCPVAPDGYAYRLREDLTWELAEAPQVAVPTTWTEETLLSMTNAQLEQILYGYGISASMTKATMVKVILLAQGGSEV